MHREISHTDAAFADESRLPLYLLTGLLGALIALDISSTFFGWPPSLGTYRYALIAAVLGGARILYSSLQSLLDGRIGADLALAIACIAAILINEPLVAAEVVFIGMVGECLEAFTFARTQRAMRKIVEVFPRRCWLLRDGQEVRVLTSELKVGDQVVVKPGAKVPVDGKVTDGRSAVDTSALTGESLPQDKGPGDHVLAGSLNQFGALTIEATQVAEQTVAGRVIELTARALKDKGDIERTADRLARYFLPVVLGLAALTLVANLVFHTGGFFRGVDAPRQGFRTALTLSMYPTLAVLVVACPCALILATPAAIIAALGRLAGTGVLIKGGAALERLAEVGAIAFDKTGTITEGRLEIGTVSGFGVGEEELLRIAASAEQNSEHPLARVILDAARAKQLALDEVRHFQAHPGAGISAETTSGRIVVGTRRLVQEQGLAISDEVQRALDQLDASGQTALLVARNGEVLGVIGARDRVRPEAAGVLEELRGLGMTPLTLLTGDREAAARAIAADLPFDEIHAELLPEQKAKLVQGMKSGGIGPRVAMVGDGINDAPALARADVGLALGGAGADIAAEAGDIVFMGDPLRPLPLLVRLSRETVRIIRQNIIIFAFVVNAIGIVLTAWLWPLLAPPEWLVHSPIAAVIYHQIGSLLVLLNSMRLLWFERSFTGPKWAGLTGRLRQADVWIDKHLDFGAFTHWLEHNWRRLVLPVILLALVIYALSGLRIVAPDELAVVRRFGGHVADLEPGWHLRFPWPIEEVTRVSQKVQTVEIGFREQKGTSAQQAFTWENKHRENRRDDEATMITGDNNLVDVQAVIRFRIKQPHVYLFEVESAEEVLRASGESVLRGLAASKPFHELLTVYRGRFQDEVLQRLKERCSTYGGLGIEIEGVSLLDLHPPADVVTAYYKVAEATEQRDQRVNEAVKEATKKLKEAQAESEKVLAQARAQHTEKVKQAEGELARFLLRSQGRKELAADQEMLLTVNATDAVLRGGDPALVRKELERRRQTLIEQQAALTDFRIYWDTIGQTLLGRDMVLIDADQIKGTRNLFLFDPDQFRVPVPMFLPPDRNPPERGPFRDKEP